MELLKLRRFFCGSVYKCNSAKRTNVGYQHFVLFDKTFVCYLLKVKLIRQELIIHNTTRCSYDHEKKTFEKVKIVRKDEHVGNQYFLLFIQSFSKSTVIKRATGCRIHMLSI